MVKLLILLPFCFLLLSATTRIEEQRKYVVPDDRPLPVEPFLVGDFRFYPHDVYLTEDLYFDSDDAVLLNSGLCLRIRRVRKGNASQQYVLQIKSEMEVPGAARLEEEDRDLLNQKIEGVRIVDMIEEIVAKRGASEKHIKLLTLWMGRKRLSSMAPFQELRRRQIDPTSLKPVVLGYSHRQRYHIIVDREERVSPLLLLKDSDKNAMLVPDRVKAHPSWIWLMEASWDQARFIKATGGAQEFVIQELEVENKYRPREMGTILINKLEKLLTTDMHMTPGRESKFFRARSFFKGK